MTIEQTGMVLDLLESAIPSAFSGERAGNKGKTLRLWAEVFSGDDMSDVRAAAIAFVNETEKGFFPTPGQIRAKMPKKMTESSFVATSPSWQKQMEMFRRYEDLKRRRREAGLPETRWEAKEAGMSFEEYDQLAESVGLGFEEILLGDEK